MNRHTELLRLYNQWRRGVIEHLDFTAKEIGEAIDEALEERAEMLEALEMMLDMSEMGGFGKSAAEDTARAVIAKAEGEQG